MKNPASTKTLASHLGCGVKSTVKLIRMLGVQCTRKPGGLLVYSKEELGKALLHFLASGDQLRPVAKNTLRATGRKTEKKTAQHPKAQPARKKVAVKAAVKPQGKSRGKIGRRKDTAASHSGTVQSPSASKTESTVPPPAPSPALQLRNPLIRIRRIVQ